MLSSPRLTLTLLLLLAVAGVFGCVVPQELDAKDYPAHFGAFAGVARLLALGRMFTSWWFLGLIALLLANVSACLVLSFGRARRRLAKRGWVAYASPVLHVSILLVAVGAILGHVPGLSVKEDLTVVQGSHERLRNSETIVTLEDFRMLYDDETGDVSTYTSEVTFEDDRGKQDATIEVNRPANFRGCQFQQASWGLAGVLLELTSPKGEKVEQPIRLAESEGEGSQGWQPAPPDNHVALPGADAVLIAIHYVPQGEAVSGPKGVEVKPVGEYPRRQFLSLKGVTGLRAGKQRVEDVGWANEQDALKWQGWTIRLGPPVFYSEFGVRRDPGLPLVWTGFLLFSVAVMVIFFAGGKLPDGVEP